MISSTLVDEPVHGRSLSVQLPGGRTGVQLCASWLKSNKTSHYT
jgi:hypothetical protein